MKKLGEYYLYKYIVNNFICCCNLYLFLMPYLCPSMVYIGKFDYTKCYFILLVMSYDCRSSHMEEKYYCDECTFIGASMLSLNSHISKTHTENNRNKAAVKG